MLTEMQFGDVEYAVRCPADGALRSPSATQAEAIERAAARDAECGKCRPGDGRHVAVSRLCSAWKPVR
jgi:hypothetical protein